MAFQVTLFAHTNLAGLSGLMVIDPDTNILYVLVDTWSVVAVDALTGNIIGRLPGLGFTDLLIGSTPQNIFISNTILGKCLVMTCGEVWGQQCQYMVIATGFVTACFIPLYNGLSAGGNNGSVTIDPDGNLWVCSTDFGGARAGVPWLYKIGLGGRAVATSDAEAAVGVNFLTEVTSPAGIEVGMRISGPNVAPGTFVAAFISPGVSMTAAAIGSYHEPPDDPEDPDDPTEPPDVYNFSREIGTVAEYDLSGAPWNFVGGNSGVWFDPATGSLLLSGRDATGNIMMRVDLADPAAVLASSRTAGTPSGQFCVGQNGTYLSDQFNIFRSSDFALIFSHSHYEYGYADLFVNEEAYDSVEQVMFVFKSFWPFTKALDVNNPTGSGAVQLADTTPTVSNPANVGGVVVNPNGGVFATAWNDGTQSYLDFWMAGTPQPRHYWGHGLNLLSSYPIVA